MSLILSALTGLRCSCELYSINGNVFKTAVFVKEKTVNTAFSAVRMGPQSLSVCLQWHSFLIPGFGAWQVKLQRWERGRNPSVQNMVESQEPSLTQIVRQREAARVSKTTLSAALASLGEMFCRVMYEIFKVDSLQKKLQCFCSGAAQKWASGSVTRVDY